MRFSKLLAGARSNPLIHALTLTSRIRWLHLASARCFGKRQNLLGSVSDTSRGLRQALTTAPNTNNQHGIGITRAGLKPSLRLLLPRRLLRRPTHQRRGKLFVPLKQMLKPPPLIGERLTASATIHRPVQRARCFRQICQHAARLTRPRIQTNSSVTRLRVSQAVLDFVSTTTIKFGGNDRRPA